MGKVSASHVEMLTFAMKEGRIVGLGEVDIGRDCDCICPRCGGDLVAKNRDYLGRKVALHFAHVSPCKPDRPQRWRTAVESVIHLLAKQIVQEQKKLYLPGCEVFPDATSEELQMPIKPWQSQFTSVVAETAVHGENADQRFVPDLLCQGSDGIIHVEFHFTHAVETAKRQAAIAQGWQMVQIDLASFADRPLDYAELQDFLCASPLDRKWIAYPAGRRLWVRLRKASKLLSNARCPYDICNAGEAPCAECPYRLTAISKAGELRCSGSTRVGSLTQLEEFERGQKPRPEPYILKLMEQKARALRLAARRKAEQEQRARELRSAAVVAAKVSELESVVKRIAEAKRRRFATAEAEVAKQLSRIATTARLRLSISEARLGGALARLADVHSKRTEFEARLDANRRKWTAAEDGTFRPHCEVCGQKMILVRGRPDSTRVYGCPDPSHPRVDHLTAAERSPPPRMGAVQISLLDDV